MSGETRAERLRDLRRRADYVLRNTHDDNLEYLARVVVELIEELSENEPSFVEGGA